MSEKLPYFRFNAYSWLSDDISLEERNVKSVFIDICAYYWTKDCERTKEQIERRFRNNLTEVQTILKVGLIKVDENEYIEISFLDEQWEALEATRELLSKAGKKSGKVRRKKRRENKADTETQTNLEPTIEQPSNPPLNYNDNDNDKENVVKTTSLYKLFVEQYANFYKKQTSIKYKFKTVDGKAYKLLIEAFINTAGEAKALAGWNYVLSNWELLDKYYSQKIKPMEIYSDLGNIMKIIKEKKNPVEKKQLYHKPKNM